MNKLRALITVVLLLILAGCASVGPTVVVETPAPAEDIVLVCMKSKDYLINLHSSGYWTDYHSGVVRSGEPFDCGILVTGKHAAVKVMHPIYVNTGSYEKDGVEHIVLNKTRLQLLEEQKAKFEAGYWDKTRNPAWEYLGSRPGCGFPHQYFEYYKQAKRVKVEHFKNRYQKPILECAKKAYIDTKKYKPHLAKKLPEPTARINQLWESIKEHEKDD